MVRDLVELSVDMIREEKLEEVHSKAEQNAEERLLDLLLPPPRATLEPDEGVIGIGSGGPYALAAAKALIRHTDLSAREIAEHAMNVAASICIYTNSILAIEEL